MKTTLFKTNGEPTDFLYRKSIKMANRILSHSNLGLTWDDLPDTNSIWDYLYDISSESDLFDQVLIAVLDRWHESDYGTISEQNHFGKIIECLTLKRINCKP